MRQFDAGDALQGLRVEDRQLAAIGGPVMDVAHEHASSSAVAADDGWKTNSPNVFSAPNERVCVLPTTKSCFSSVAGARHAVPECRRIAVPMALADHALVDAGELLALIVEA